MQTIYLVEHPAAGRAPFTRLDGEHGARAWADDQTRFHTPDIAFRWTDGGEHGWHAQCTPTGAPFDGAATIYTLVVDGTIPQDETFDDDLPDTTEVPAGQPRLEVLTDSTTWDVESEGHGNYWFVLSHGFTSYEDAERRMNARGTKAAQDQARIVRNDSTRSIDHGPGHGDLDAHTANRDAVRRVLHIATLIDAGAPWAANLQNIAAQIRAAATGDTA